MGIMRMPSRAAIVFLATFWLPTEALAATRTVYFSQTGRNIATTAGGVGTTVRSVCRITVSNPSSSRQLISVQLNGAATVAFTGNASPSHNTTDEELNTTTTTSRVYSIDYPNFTAGTAATQQLICKGQITVKDPTGEGPGYVVATGTLTTFTASGTIQTAGTPGGAPVLGGPAVFTQIPVAINRGKPF